VVIPSSSGLGRDRNCSRRLAPPSSGPSMWLLLFNALITRLIIKVVFPKLSKLRYQLVLFQCLQLRSLPFAFGMLRDLPRCSSRADRMGRPRLCRTLRDRYQDRHLHCARLRHPRKDRRLAHRHDRHDWLQLDLEPGFTIIGIHVDRRPGHATSYGGDIATA
jgi:hypothetical protein